MTPIIINSTFTPFQWINLFLVKKYHYCLTNKICVLKAYRYKEKDFHEFNVVMSFFFNIKQKIYVEIKTFFTEIEKTRKLK
jgi:hypothetical protein